jgi:DNA-binding response OmpR family regulator
MAEESKPQPSGKLADPKTKEILIVDDDEGMLNLMEVLVKRDGFQIDLARTGDEALEKLKRPHDALILDLMLPGSTTGFDVLTRLASLPGRIPPVIVVTAFGASKEVDLVRANPFVALVLDKPINQKKLLSTLHEVLKTQPKPW